MARRTFTPTGCAFRCCAVWPSITRLFLRMMALTPCRCSRRWARSATITDLNAGSDQGASTSKTLWRLPSRRRTYLRARHWRPQHQHRFNASLSSQRMGVAAEGGCNRRGFQLHPAAAAAAPAFRGARADRATTTVNPDQSANSTAVSQESFRQSRSSSGFCWITRPGAGERSKRKLKRSDSAGLRLPYR